MKTEIKEIDLEISREGLSHQKELEIVAKRFGMTEEQAVESIIHNIYMSGANSCGLETALVLLGNIEDVNYNCDGTPIEDEEEIFDEYTPF